MRLNDVEKKYLKVMAELGQGPYSTMDITEKLGVESKYSSEFCSIEAYQEGNDLQSRHMGC